MTRCPRSSSYLAKHPTGDDAPTVAADVRKGETPLGAYYRRQEATAKILNQLRGIERAPAPPDEVRAALADQIDDLAKAPSIVNGALMIPKTVVPVGPQAATLIDALGFVCWAFRDQIKAAVQALVPDDPTAITSTQRASELEAAQVALVDALRAEVACAIAAEGAGQRVVRRRNVHPAILIGRVVSPAAVYRYAVKGVQQCHCKRP